MPIALRLTPRQESDFVRDGYVQLPGLVGQAQVAAALRAINRDIGAGLPAEQIPGYLARSFCPALCAAAPILDLLVATPALAVLESALGGPIRVPGGAQIALRFPGYGQPATLSAPHLDGFPDAAGSNGIAPDAIASFTALVCVLLSEVTEDFQGNFVVYPGSHRQMSQWVRAHGVAALAGGVPSLPLAAPVQITGRAGDVIIAHYLLMHGVAANDGPAIRYACFFRTETPDLAAHRAASLTALWRDWRGLPGAQCEP